MKRIALFDCERHGRFEKITTTNAGPSFHGSHPCPVCDGPAILLQWESIDPAAPFCPHCRRIGSQGGPRRLAKMERISVLIAGSHSSDPWRDAWRCPACTDYFDDDAVAGDQALQSALEAAGHTASTILNPTPKELS